MRPAPLLGEPGAVEIRETKEAVADEVGLEARSQLGVPLGGYEHRASERVDGLGHGLQRQLEGVIIRNAYCVEVEPLLGAAEEDMPGVAPCPENGNPLAGEHIGEDLELGALVAVEGEGEEQLPVGLEPVEATSLGRGVEPSEDRF